MNAAVVDVAVAVLQQDNGEFLLARRPAGKPYAGYWEFPGGKIEAGEEVLHALARELAEELGIVPRRAYPWITRVFAYPHATVRLHFCRVPQWSGTPHAHEHLDLRWQTAERVEVKPMLPANAPVLKALRLPTVYGITHGEGLGERVLLERLDTALDRGLRLLQVREKRLERGELRRFAAEVLARARAHGAMVLINGDWELAAELGAHGVHLTSTQLMTIPSRPGLEWCGASCHNAAELACAAELGLDFVVLGPVLPTASHPGAPNLGWQRFFKLVRDYPLPVYALGGLRPSDLETAWAHGAHGISMLRAVWE